ncbi:hypothetical protein MCOR27_007927 [Pyricularia oryzae]|uniref:Nucleoside phosphorylase domain-containing protein n=2 Tax=Pyricularia TaxID=48558 RepID=A0ABQ8NZ96_PYRGI|nr:hypothetical protein MCOR01_001422 [Pyricularia oryzae]KAI6304245.1 hypothetical protein MCOR33_000760 [Pyricularia grisea]KAH9430032.1 hypothetical protein MCOR02_009754 [Pyricularia oryzae]KAI6257013.1 hypothetical protein MCOR19_006523 [Pyricularia oryzae]KAI6273331.1 hypothetical protein MCOR27_007927 [Pyricularia oryzae]
MTTQPSRPKRRQDIEIALVCALPIEYDAICLSLDKIWDDDDHGSQAHSGGGEHQNKYTTGVVGRHNVVLALSSGTGKLAMNSLTSDLTGRFAGIKLLVLAGICAGVPSAENDMLLGDVVISRTLVQYDFGKHVPGGFDSTVSVNENPHPSVRAMVVAFQTERERDRLVDRATEYLEEIQARAGSKRRRVDYSRPPAATDRLFSAAYLHRHRGADLVCGCTEANVCTSAVTSTCDELGCDTTQLMRRPRLDRVVAGEEPAELDVFVGRFGSGDAVVRSGEYRDRMVREHGVVAIEMEGAGPWDGAPCVVVKGVCDFADSHKSKRWQRYAAATSAAVTKAILQGWVGGGGGGEENNSGLGEPGGMSAGPWLAKTPGAVYNTGNIFAHNTYNGDNVFNFSK